MCMCERERERQRQRETETDRQTDRDRERKFTMCVVKARTIYFFKRSINNVHAKTAAKGSGSPVLSIEASQRK